ncbi:hypothetical protein R4064_11720, partial [Micrococcus yunnanensis]
MPSTTVFSTPSKDRHRLAFRTPFSALQVTDLNSQKPRQRAACPRQRLARTPTEASGEPDNGPEFISEAMADWAGTRTGLSYIPPG